MKNFSFSKQERLCNRNDFQKLFSEGRSFYCYPFRCIYLWKETSDFSVKIAVSVSKKKFKRAVDRNRIKRIARESYRLEKGILYQKYTDTSKQVDILVIYTETKILPFLFVRKKIIEIMNKIKK
jgi:ribonuclease P protein component